MIDYSLEPKYKEIFDYLSLRASEAYKDIDMLSNETLSKNPYSSVFIEQKLKNSMPPNISIWFIIKKLFIYYKKSFKGFYYYIANFFVYIRHAKKFKFKKTDKELIVIDTFFIIDKIIEQKEDFSDSYFGLDDTLHKLGKEYAYLPFFYGLFSPKKMREVFCILKQNNYPVVCEYDLLSLLDFFRIIFFIIRYPFKVICFSTSLDSTQANDKLLSFAMIEGLNAVTFHRYSRYLQGKHFEKLGNVKLISWYENQTIDKNLYRGIRDANANVYIFGAQLFLFSQTYMNILVDESEILCKTTPDVILVNGRHYLPKSDIAKFEIGPSLRYKKLFETKIPKLADRNSIAVLLSYILDDAKNVLQLLNQLNIDMDIIIKPHPAVDIRLLEDFIRPNYNVASSDIYEIAKKAKFVIASSTGAMLELASLGMPIFVVKSKNIFDNDLMLELGKNVLWYEVKSQKELLDAIKTIEAIKNDDILQEIASKYKELFFCEPSMENIKKAFKL